MTFVRFTRKNANPGGRNGAENMAKVLGIDLDPSEVLGQDDLFDRVWSEEFDSILDEDEDSWGYVDDSDDD